MSASMNESSRNVWLSWKRVTKRPKNMLSLLGAGLASGATADVSVSDDPLYPAMYVDVEGDTLRIGLSTLIESLVCSSEREAQRWTTLVTAENVDGKDGSTLYGNNVLTASRRAIEDDHGGFAVLSYHWRDRAPIRDWRVGQRVKNELCGDEWEAVEMYPAESRLMDESNEYWLVAFPPGHPLHDLLSNLGNPTRSVMTQAELDAEPLARDKAVQRDDDGTLVR